MRNLIPVGMLFAAAAGASAQPVTLTIENNLPSGNFSFTPVWFAMHNGGFNIYNNGELASNFPGLTELAEDGMTGPISAAFGSGSAGLAGGVDGTLMAVSGPGDAPVFAPGESASVTFSPGDTTVNRYFSYASMVVPSNDLFFANADPFAHEIFDTNGDFTGPVTILVFGESVNDNGTEVNNAFGDAAFSANGGARQGENNPIRRFFTVPGDEAYLDSFIGTNTADGGTISSRFGPGDLIATIHIVPAPGAAAVLAFAGLGAMRRKR